MRPLKIDDRLALDSVFIGNAWDSFYHYFPLTYAISESTEKIMVDEEGGYHYAGKDLYYPPRFFVGQKMPKSVDKVWISLIKCPSSYWVNELYDVNFIYDLGVTLKIKNFRKNVKKFTKSHPKVFYGKPDSNYWPWEIVKQWYQKSLRKEFSDFGYTRWLTLNYDEFSDLHPRVVMVDEEPVAFSLWGELREGLGIHLICKDLGWPYLQDYTRAMTYAEMEAQGFTTVNDGGDCGIHGINVYKHKLRPKFIVPIYSWVRKDKP